MNDPQEGLGPDVQTHYSRLAADYDSLWEHSKIFRDWMVDRILERVRLVPGHIVADIGGGTGIYAQALLDRVAGLEIFVVDPSPEMLNQVEVRQGIHVLLGSGSSAARSLMVTGPREFRLVLIKEAVHHFEQIDDTLKSLGSLLAPGGTLLVVMLPKSIDYPLFGAALRRFEDLQPDPVDVENSLRAAGLVVERTQERYRLEIPRERWIAMVKGRFMSLLSTFTNDQLAKGVEELQARFADAGVVSFDDSFEFISGVRLE